MKPGTQALWSKQDQHHDDRRRLFEAVARATDAEKVLYPGSFVDVAASFVFGSVTYVDTDSRARRFFDDVEGVQELVASQDGAPADPEIVFLAADYTDDLGLGGGFDLLVSLYAGLVSEHCTRYLRRGGHLLVGSSHGDAAMASLDERYRLSGVVVAAAGGYRVDDDGLEAYLVPKRGTSPTREELRRTGRGIGYTKTASSYLFTRCR